MGFGVKHIALKDISEYFKNIGMDIRDCHNDIWIVTPARLDTKEQRTLNMLLGLDKINKLKQTK